MAPAAPSHATRLHLHSIAQPFASIWIQRENFSPVDPVRGLTSRNAKPNLKHRLFFLFPLNVFDQDRMYAHIRVRRTYVPLPAPALYRL